MLPKELSDKSGCLLRAIQEWVVKGIEFHHHTIFHPRPELRDAGRAPRQYDGSPVFFDCGANLRRSSLEPTIRNAHCIDGERRSFYARIIWRRRREGLHVLRKLRLTPFHPCSAVLLNCHRGSPISLQHSWRGIGDSARSDEVSDIGFD